MLAICWMACTENCCAMLSAMACARTLSPSAVCLSEVWMSSTWKTYSPYMPFTGADRTPFSVVEAMAPTRRGSTPGPFT